MQKFCICSFNLLRLYTYAARNNTWSYYPVLDDSLKLPVEEIYIKPKAFPPFLRIDSRELRAIFSGIKR